MIRHCSPDDPYIGTEDGSRCGLRFDDIERSVVCPHDRLPRAFRQGLENIAHPTWPEKPKYVYVASSWRNPIQIAVVAALQATGIDHYDFKNPPNGTGFHWSSVMPSYEKVGPGSVEQKADAEEYLKALDHPTSRAGYESDFDAMMRADAFVLVLPCGRSAHLELGWACGMGKRTAILLDPDDNNKVTPELMYKMVDFIAPTFMDLLGWLGVED